VQGAQQARFFTDQIAQMPENCEPNPQDAQFDLNNITTTGRSNNITGRTQQGHIWALRLTPKQRLSPQSMMYPQPF
jgi:hypothetical protein